MTDCYLGSDCRGPKYHVCLAGKEDTFPQLVRAMQPVLEKQKRRAPSSFTQEHRDAIRESQLQRWAAVKEKNKDRDAQIVRRYQEGGIGYVALAQQFDIGKDAVLRILKDAEAELGISILRPPGRTISRGA